MPSTQEVQGTYRLSGRQLSRPLFYIDFENEQAKIKAFY